jgi:hypothetical protein
MHSRPLDERLGADWLTRGDVRLDDVPQYDALSLAQLHLF